MTIYVSQVNEYVRHLAALCRAMEPPPPDAPAVVDCEVLDTSIMEPLRAYRGRNGFRGGWVLVQYLEASDEQRAFNLVAAAIPFPVDWSDYASVRRLEFVTLPPREGDRLDPFALVGYMGMKWKDAA